MKVQAKHGKVTQIMHGASRNYRYVWDVSACSIVRPDMRYCFRSGRCRPNPRTKHISVPPRHMTKSYIPDFNMISQHYRYKDTTSHTIDIQLPESLQQRKIHVW